MVKAMGANNETVYKSAGLPIAHRQEEVLPFYGPCGLTYLLEVSDVRLTSIDGLTVVLRDFQQLDMFESVAALFIFGPDGTALALDGLPGKPVAHLHGGEIVAVGSSLRLRVGDIEAPSLYFNLQEVREAEILAMSPADP